MIRLFGSFFTAALTIAAVSVAAPVKADTVNARCDVYPKGSDLVSWYGACTFSQRQGVVGIQLANGKRYDLVPVGKTGDEKLKLEGEAKQAQASAMNTAADLKDKAKNLAEGLKNAVGDAIDSVKEKLD